MSVKEGREAFDKAHGKKDTEKDPQPVTTKVAAGRELKRTGRLPEVQTGGKGTEATA